MSDDEIIRNDLYLRIQSEENKITQSQLATFKLQFDHWKAGGYFHDGKLFHHYDEIPVEIRLINAHKIYRFECADDGTIFNFLPFRQEQQTVV